MEYLPVEVVGVSGSLRSFGSLLRCQRQISRVGLRELARATSLSHSYLSRVERDLLPPPSAATIRRLAQALHTDSARLFAAAGVISDEVLSFFFSRPEAATIVFHLVSTMSDGEIETLCDDLARRVTAPPKFAPGPARLAPKDEFRPESLRHG